MDALFHFMLSFVGGYILLRGLRIEFRWRELFLLSLLAGLIDIDHLINIAESFHFHNLTFIIGVPLLAFLAFRYLKRKKLQAFSLVLIVMWIGHLLADMIQGIYGVPLFFPFSTRLYMIPMSWSFFEIDYSFVIAPGGIAIGIYFGLIFSILLLKEMKGKRTG